VQKASRLNAFGMSDSSDLVLTNHKKGGLKATSRKEKVTTGHLKVTSLNQKKVA